MNVLISGGAKNGKTGFAQDIAVRLSAGGNGTFLVDSVTALLMNEMFSAHGGEADPEAVGRCIGGLSEILNKARNAVFVTDYIYSDAFRYDEFTENYRASLARLDRYLAEKCDTVIELCAGSVIFHKGGLEL